MIIEVLHRSEKEVEACDYRGAMQINIDGEKAFAVHDGEPEDASLVRDFNDAYKIPDLLKKAFEAGKNGETLEIIESDSDDI